MPVAVEITRSEVLRPSAAGGGGKRSPLTVFDRAATDWYIPAVFAWDGAAAPSNDEVKGGLAAVLAKYPHLAGRFDVDERGRRCFNLNDAGVRVLEATVAADLADALAHDVAAHVNELYPKADMENADEAVFQVQLTRYACGGLVIGTACNHQVSDGQSMSFFYVAWAAAVRSAGATLPTPFVDRAAIAVPRGPPAPAFDHRNIDLGSKAMAVAVEITRSEVLRPSETLAAGGGGKRSPLTVFDRAAMDWYIPAVFAWDGAAAPSNDEVKGGLAAVLARYPHLAGRFDVDERGRRCFNLNDAGVRVLEATVAADLADALAHDVAAHVNELYPKADMENADEPVFQVQLTRYACGGLVIGTACNHQVSDGQSMSFFYVAWAAAVRSAGATLPTPFVDRAAIAVPRGPPAPAFDHRNIEFKGEHSWTHSYGSLPLERIRNLAVHFPDEFVAGLKSHVGARCSTFQCLLAHAWKKIMAARDLSPEEYTQVRVAVNCRGRASPAVPMDYFGNMVLWAFPRMRVRDLLSSSYAAVVGVIRDAVARVDEPYIQSFVDFGEVAAGDELTPTAAPPGTVFCPDLEVDSWLGFRFHDLDFGRGPPCAFLPPDLPVEGMLIFVPSCAAKGGVEMYMALDDLHYFISHMV
uniref:Uncharacterized protein n=1 Tax=Oryza nivara TaxID=4536 RepID=A0A0E0IRJ4_ORYNI